MSDQPGIEPADDPTARQRRELADRLRDLDGVIAAERRHLRDAPAFPLPGPRPDLVGTTTGPQLRDAAEILRRLREAERLRDDLVRELRDLDLGRIRLDVCERAALAWLHRLRSAEQLLAELRRDPTFPRPRPPIPPRPPVAPPRPPVPPRPPIVSPPGGGRPGPASRDPDLEVARAILRYRDRRRLRGGIERLEELRAVAGVDAAWLAHLRFTGCEIARRDPQPDPPPDPDLRTSVGVLLPLRLETRFDPGALRLRVVPDEPWFSAHDPSVSAGELTALERYVAAHTAATDEAAGRVAFDELVAAVTGARAVWLVRTHVGTDDDGQLTVLRPPDDELRTEPLLPGIHGFPDRLQVWLARGGNPPQLALTLEVDQARLRPGLPDPDLDEHRWWDDWDEAVAAGLAGIVPLPGDPNDIDALYVTGLGDAPAAELFEAHRDAGLLGLVPPGTPTNTVDGAPAASLATRSGEWWDALQTPPGEVHRAVSRLLTGDPDLLGNLPGTDEPQRDRNAAAVAALWPALWGFAADDVWATGGHAVGLPSWAVQAVAPEGPYPTLRVTTQPYGLLPATSLTRWRPGKQDPPVEAAMLSRLRTLEERWREAAEQRGTTEGATAEQLLDLLASVPTSPGYRHRPAWALELWWLVAVLLGFGGPFADLDAAWRERHALAEALGLTPARRYGATWAPRRVALPLLRPRAMPDTEPLAQPIDQLVKVAFGAPHLFADPVALEQELFAYPLDSLFLRLVVRSLQVALGDVGREALGEAPPPDLDPVARPAAVPANLERWLAAVDPRNVQRDTPATRTLRRVVDGLMALAQVEEERLDWLVRATIDTATHRLDPWLTAIPSRRLDDLLQGGGARLRLGAYGWVDRPAPGTPGPTVGGLLHAPSQGQAVTAAFLRDRAVNDPEPERWGISLTSRSVRVADRIGEQIRAGAHVAEAVGREVERAVGRPDAVDRLRVEYPLRVEHAGRRTCDGLAVLKADPAALDLPAATLAELDELRAAVDTYGDLLVAESLHHLTQGRGEAASAAMDAAAGLGRPPHLDAIRTHREGRSVATGVLLAVEDVDDPLPPTSRLEQAETSPASLVDAAAAEAVVRQFGAADAWRWSVAVGGGPPQEVTLADLGLVPADALALPLADLERLVVEVGAESLDPDPDEDPGLGDREGSERYEQAARFVGLLGRDPATPDAADPAADAVGDDGGVVGDLAARFTRVRGVAVTLTELLSQQLAETSPDGQLGDADEDALRRLVVAARRWGIAPDPEPPVEGDEGDPAGRRLVAVAARTHELLAERLEAAPPGSGELGRAELVEALTALVSPTGQLAVLSRLPADALPPLTRSGDGGTPQVDQAWLPVVAAVRPRLARLELHQLLALPADGPGVAMAAWTSKPADPWQQNEADPLRLIVVYADDGLALTGSDAPARVAVASLDRFSEFVPSQEQTTSATFGFDAPASRAPQAILLATPPDVDEPLDAEAVRDIVVETRRLARVRMVRPADLGTDLRGLLPSALLPATGRIAVPLEPHG